MVFAGDVTDFVDDPNEPTDNDLAEEEQAIGGESRTGGQSLAYVTTVKESPEDEAQFVEPIASPSVIGEEDSVSGSSSDSEPVDIDEALKEVGLKNDD